jgi:phosphate starvation-inducible protein PhoH
VSKKQRQAFFQTDAATLPASLMGSSAKGRGPAAAAKPEPILKAQTPGQKGYIRKLTQNHHDILFVTGPAGTGKTYAAVLDAIIKFRRGDCTKIILTRPMVGAGGEELGILPGGITEKVAPWCIPLLDIFKEFYSKYEVEQMIDREDIEIAPLALMRGRTLKNAIVIADEAQNCTVEQMKMLMTRIGSGSYMVITGDVEQHDRPNGSSGLADVVQRLASRDARDWRDAIPGAIVADDDSVSWPTPKLKHERIGVVKLGRADIVRHAVIDDVLALYEE